MHPSRRLSTIVFTLLAFAAAPAVRAQDKVPVPVGDRLILREAQLQPDDTVIDYFEPSFAARPGGGFLAGWSLVRNGSDEPDQIQVQAYNHLDREVGPTRRIDADPPFDIQRQLALASENGRVVAVWARSVGLDSVIVLRYLNSAGQPVTDEAIVGAGTNTQPAVALDPSGIALVVWVEFTGDRLELNGRIFGPDGNPRSPTLDLDGGVGVSGAPSVGVDGDGNFLVAWSDDFDADARVHARWIDVLGQTVVPTFDVVDSTALDPSVSVAPDGRAVVAWTTCRETDANADDPCDVLFRVLGEDGLPAEPPVRANPLDGRAHNQPAVGMADDGEFGLAWRACRINPVGALFDCLVTTSFHSPDGDRYGNRLQMERDGEPTDFTVVPLGDDFVVGWFRFSCDNLQCDSGFESVYAQRYRLTEADPQPDGEELFPEIPPGAPALASPDFPDFRFYVRIGRAGSDLFGNQETECLPETICVSGALPGRTEVQLRVIGPRPNGFLWPTIVKFTTSTVEVWIEQISTGEVEYYGLDGATPGSSELPGLFDRTGFQP